MPVHEKAALLVPSGPSHDPDRKHLHIVCTEPDANGDVVIVGIASYTGQRCDQTCILQPNEHPWLNRESYVIYRFAQIVSAGSLVAKVQDETVLVRADMNAQAFLRVRNGLCASPQTKRKVKRYLGCQ